MGRMAISSPGRALPVPCTSDPNKKRTSGNHHAERSEADFPAEQGRRDSNPRPTVLEYAAGRLGYAETGSDAPRFAPAPRCRSSSSAHENESSGDMMRAVLPSRAGVRGAA